MLINSNSKLCNYNTSAEIQIIRCPQGERVRRRLSSLRCVRDAGSHGAALPPPSPSPRPPLPHSGSSCFSLFSKKTGPERALAPGQFAASLCGWGRRAAPPRYFWPAARTEPSGPAFSQWPKWPFIYLQKVNSRCHGNGTSLPGPVKIHLCPPLGRGRKGKKLQLQGEDERREGPAGFSCRRVRTLLPLFIIFNNSEIIGTGLRDTNDIHMWIRRKREKQRNSTV